VLKVLLYICILYENVFIESVCKVKVTNIFVVKYQTMVEYTFCLI